MNRSIPPYMVALAALTGALSWTSRSSAAQECDLDGDCGHGFFCEHRSVTESSGFTSTGGVPPSCGDGICQSNQEDVDSCSADCVEITTCRPVDCEGDEDCAEGYECAPRTGGVAIGGTSGPICGDGICSSTETEQNCAEDCVVPDVCRVIQVACNDDEDCPTGSYCYTPSSSGGAAAGVGGASSASTSVGFTGAGGAPSPAPEQGVCIEGSGTTGGSVVGGVGGAVAVGQGGAGADSGVGFTGVGAADSGEGGSAMGAGATGSGGVSTGTGAGPGVTGVGGGETQSSSGSGATGGLDATTGTGAAANDAATANSPNGCSCAVVGGSSSRSMGALALLGVLFAGWRRRRGR